MPSGKEERPMSVYENLEPLGIESPPVEAEGVAH
jgi:hypothetical protein